MRGPSDGLEELIVGTLVLVDCTSKLRLGPLLDEPENTERNFCFHLFGDCLLLGVVDMMARGNLR